jgi:hypothetical protein
MNQNIVMLVGRIATKPQLKPYKKSDGTEGYRCFFRLAVSRLMDRGAKRGEGRTNFIPCVAWGDQAKRHAQYLDVGTEATVVGELIVDSNRKEDGTFGPDFFNVQVRDVQYGQPSLKNATAETLSRRQATIEARLKELATAGSSIATPAAAPVATPAGVTAGRNPFTPDGSAPAPIA